MDTHAFKIDQIVRLSGSSVMRNAVGIYTVTALLPEERGDRQYRLRNTESAQQRVAWESQLSAIEPES
ncbi:hypothetical protein [Propylenella binzhouense]|uniref:Uncharacterized protein n=1 Tax=Propylenella binzhouense TaxID=2555902 RepID=A0A964T174_9HYPH|nr:hypothetical protein [Propylenella binzhouense]MYZ46541.1 hypothetical protein [Propylenella binzhouense]